MILQTTFTDGEQVNTDLGKEYSLIEKGICQDKFNEASKTYYGEDHVSFEKDTYAFIVSDSVRKIIPLYKDFHNAIITENGALFSNLTFK